MNLSIIPYLVTTKRKVKQVKQLLLICLMMLAGSAWAEWVMYDQTDTNTFYYDPATIRKDGHIRRVWKIQDLRKRSQTGFMSARTREEFDCKQERMRYLGLSEHSEPMAGGKTLNTWGEDKDWREVPPGTSLETIFNIVCAK
jgi:hypothetical protein